MLGWSEKRKDEKEKSGERGGISFFPQFDWGEKMEGKENAGWFSTWAHET